MSICGIIWECHIAEKKHGPGALRISFAKVDGPSLTWNLGK